MSKQNFSRINVDMNSLNVSSPGRSGFNLSKSSMQSIPFGKLYPVRCTKLMPNSTVKGSVNPDLQLEKFATPAAGRMRLDTHTFMVAAKRIHKDFKSFIESGITGRTALNLPSFKLGYQMVTYFLNWIRLQGSTTFVFADMLTSASSGMPTGLYNPSLLYRSWLSSVVNGNLNPLIYLPTLPTYNKNIADYFSVEHDRLDSILKSLTARMENGDFADDFTSITGVDDLAKYWNGQYYLGDFFYDVFLTLFGEGSVLDQLGYPIFSYFGILRERLNAADKAARVHALNSGAVTTVWDSDALDAYIDGFGTNTVYDALCIKDFDLTDGFIKDSSWDVSLSEMPIRANYAVWFDYFRDWHLDPETSCPNPDDFDRVTLLSVSSTSVNATYIIALLAPRYRNWSRDGFTMVQPDDVYRHVYAPAVDDKSTSVLYDYDSGGFDAKFETIYAGALSEFVLPFPSSFTTLFGTSFTANTYYHDLQTMRRAEMLKRKLTRDYYNPDTYVGQHMARWGVEPADFEIQCVQYLGGNESMISGDQVTSPVETDATTLGQRTLVANAASNDSFVYNMSEWAYLISYVSIVPLVHYDALNPTLQELSVHDQPIPEYANDNQVVIRSCDMLRDYFASGQSTMLGYVPRYYGYRMALDDVHGKYLREYRSYTWLRDRKSAGDSMLTKNAINAHVNVALDCFIGLREWDTVAFGNIQLPLFVECALPDKLENV